jgi:CDP-L-myo-inositol myo-inositolphosphotransferase
MPAKDDGLVSRYLNRRFSQPFSAIILRFWPNCDPNLISILSAVFGFMGAVAFWAHQPIIGGILIQISSIVDGCDGEIARATGRVTYFGGFFDSILDRYIDFVVLGSMASFSLLFLSPQWVLLLATTSISGSFLVSYSAAKAETKEGLRFSRTIQGRDTRLFLIFLAGVSSIFTLWTIPLCLILITVLTHTTVFLRIFQVKNSEKV